jgi:uncharacterized protein
VNLEDIKRHQDQLDHIANKYEITKILLFGSVARGENTIGSDLDFLVEMKEGASMLGIGGFSYEVERLFGVPVEVIPVSVLPNVNDAEFVRRIQSEAVPI